MYQHFALFSIYSINFIPLRKKKIIIFKQINLIFIFFKSIRLIKWVSTIFEMHNHIMYDNSLKLSLKPDSRANEHFENFRQNCKLSKYRILFKNIIYILKIWSFHKNVKSNTMRNFIWKRQCTCLNWRHGYTDWPTLILEHLRLKKNWVLIQKTRAIMCLSSVKVIFFERQLKNQL